MSTSPLLEASGLSHTYNSPDGNHPIKVLDDICFSLNRGESLGLIGPSGAGKSTLARLLAGLEAPGQGYLGFKGAPLSTLRLGAGPRRASRVQMVWQDPMIYLNPYLSAHQCLAEALSLREVAKSMIKAKAEELLERVHLPLTLAKRRPHEISGGQAQRLALARALALDPDVLVCDEVFSSLDLPAQAGIIDLLSEIIGAGDMAAIIISHDLVPIYRLCQRCLVLDSGRIVESGRTADVLTDPKHALTRNLVLKSL